MSRIVTKLDDGRGEKTLQETLDRINRTRMLANTGGSYVKNSVVTENCMSESEYEEMERQERVKENMQEAKMAAMTFPRRLDDYADKIHHKLFDYTLRRVYVNAVPLNLNEEQTVLAMETVDTFSNNMDFYKKYLDNQEDVRGPSRFSKKLNREIKTIVQEKVNEKLIESKEKGPSNVVLDFSLEEEDKEKLDKSLVDVGIDEVSEAIKEKVIRVVREEQQRQKKEKEEIDELVEEANDDMSGDQIDENQLDQALEDDNLEDEDEINNEENVKESDEEDEELDNEQVTEMAKMIYEKNNTMIDGNATLFESIMFSILKEAQEQEVEVVGDEEYDEDEEITEESYIDNSVSMGVRPDTVQHPDLHRNIDMDMVFAETVANYTLLEMAYTLNLQEFTHDTVRDIVQNA